jgi:hypothetical protein
MKLLIALFIAMNVSFGPELLAVGLMVYAIVPIAACFCRR